MKVYLDICAIQRPLDTANQARIMLEAEAVLGLVTLCDAGQLELVSSEALITKPNKTRYPCGGNMPLLYLVRPKALSPSIKL
jgi:hypothetical protein